MVDVSKITEDLFDAQCIQIIRTQGLSLHTRMESAKNLLDVVGADVTALIAEKLNAASLETQLDHACAILQNK